MWSNCTHTHAKRKKRIKWNIGKYPRWCSLMGTVFTQKPRWERSLRGRLHRQRFTWNHLIILAVRLHRAVGSGVWIPQLLKTSPKVGLFRKCRITFFLCGCEKEKNDDVTARVCPWRSPNTDIMTTGKMPAYIKMSAVQAKCSSPNKMLDPLLSFLRVGRCCCSGCRFYFHWMCVHRSATKS